MYIRFITSEIDERSGKHLGLFTLAYNVVRENEVDIYTVNIIKKHLEWFGRNLEIPAKFSRNKNDSHKNTHGVCWFKAERSEMISRCYELKNMLEEAGFRIEVVKKRYAGKIVFEDEYQVVVI